MWKFVFGITLMRKQLLDCLQLEKCLPYPKTNKRFYRCGSIPLFFDVSCIWREAYFHDDIKSDDGYFMANCSGCSEWYHKKSMNIQVKVFWHEKYHMLWKCSVCRKKVYELYNLYNENKGLICRELICGEIRHFQKLGCENIFLAHSRVYVRETAIILPIIEFTKVSHFTD